jgi:hypothetical protein
MQLLVHAEVRNIELSSSQVDEMAQAAPTLLQFLQPDAASQLLNLKLGMHACIGRHLFTVALRQQYNMSQPVSKAHSFLLRARQPCPSRQAQGGITTNAKDRDSNTTEEIC